MKDQFIKINQEEGTINIKWRIERQRGGQDGASWASGCLKWQQ
jgi:hypothetical protein